MTIDLKELFNISTDLNSRMVQAILSAMKDAHQDGFDYLKFKHSVKNLQNMNMDELTSMKSAFSTASSFGVTKTLLVKSINHYVNTLKKERDEFAQTHKRNIESRINDPKAEIARLQKLKEDNLRTIEKLRRENEMIDQKLEGISSNISTSEAKIEETKQEFLKVYDAFLSSMEKDKSMIDQLLG